MRRSVELPSIFPPEIHSFSEERATMPNKDDNQKKRAEDRAADLSAKRVGAIQELARKRDCLRR